MGVQRWPSSRTSLRFVAYIETLLEVSLESEDLRFHHPAHAERSTKERRDMKYGIIEQGYVRQDADPHERVLQLIAEAKEADRVGISTFGLLVQSLSTKESLI